MYDPSASGTKLRVPMIRGSQLNLAGIDFNLPALNARLLKELEEDIDFCIEHFRDKAGRSPELLERVVKVVTAGMKLNYLEITEEDVGEMIDSKNMQLAWQAIVFGMDPIEFERMRAAAVAQRIAGKPDPGEVKAGAETTGN